MIEELMKMSVGDAFPGEAFFPTAYDTSEMYLDVVEVTGDDIVRAIGCSVSWRGVLMCNCVITVDKEFEMIGVEVAKF